VNSYARSIEAGWTPHPPVIRSGLGSRILDEDGREYLDCLLGLGAVFPGHREPAICAAVERHIRDCGSMFALPVAAEAEVAEKIVAMVPAVEQVRFCNTGTEAMMFAVRIARAWTRRQRIVLFEGMYHGFGDSVSIDPARIILPWNDENAVEEAFRRFGDDIAAVLTEPIMCNSGCRLPARDFLSFLERRTRSSGALLIFDEVITGFRLGAGGAQGRYGIAPDLTAFGKALGGGYPVACLGGRSDILNLVADGSVRMMGTYAANGAAVAAAGAALDLYQSTTKVADADALGEALQSRLRVAAKDHGVAARVDGVGPIFQITFLDEDARSIPSAYSWWWREMIGEGVIFHPDPSEVLFLSTAHQQADIDEFLACAGRVFAVMAAR
jgi:glutamate-1-semialdehyde 2,1-aminomutase